MRNGSGTGGGRGGGGERFKERGGRGKDKTSLGL